MSASTAQARPMPASVVAPASQLFLARIAVDGGATRAEIGRELGPFFHHRFSPAEWRRSAEERIAALIAAGLASEKRGRLTATEAGLAAARAFLGSQGSRPAWAEQRDIALIARGLGLGNEKASQLKVLARPDGLRTAIVQSAFGLKLKKNEAPAHLRARLALIALERAFGNKLKSELGKGTALSSKAQRLLAGQLSASPRDFGSDQRLIAELAAERTGARQSDPDSLRLAILRGLSTRLLDEEEASAARPAPRPRPLPQAANDRLPSSRDAGPPRPDPNEFARAVTACARTRAEGWPGNRKAYISHTWAAIRAQHAHWCLTEIEFKCMLAEAHRLGHIVLANADLKDKRNIADIESSATLYKNTVWHFVRVED